MENPSDKHVRPAAQGRRSSLFQDSRLRRLFQKDDARGLPPQYVPKIKRILSVLTTVSGPSAVRRYPQWRPHPLKGNLKGFWAVDVSARDRIVFRFEGNQVCDIRLVDYH